MNVPKRKPRDAEKIRKEHLANLALEASNNQLNQNAALMLKNTGRSSLLPDQNTPTDKYANEEGKKQLVRDFLSGNDIMNTFNAEEVIQRLSPAQIQFFDQYKDFIKKDFKGKRVPVDVFVNYLMKLQRKEAETQGVEYNLQQVSGAGIQLQLTSQWMSEEGRRAVMETIAKTPMTNIQRRMLETNIEQLDSYMLTSEEVSRILTFSPFDEVECMRLFNDMLQDYPKAEQIVSALMAGQVVNAIDITKLSAAIVETSHHLRGLIREYQPEQREEPPLVPERAEAPGGFGEYEEAPPAEYDPFEPPAWGQTTPSNVASEIEPPEPEPIELIPPGQFRDLPEDEKFNYVQRILPASVAIKLSRAAGRMLNTVRSEEDFIDWYNTAYAKLGGKGRGIKGRGLVKRKTPAERSSGYEKPKPYRQFGRYLVHAPKLEEGILMIKTPAGAKIKELPSQHITPELKKVLRVMAKGEQPSFAHCQGLGVEDQSKLHHIIRHSQFGMELPDRDEDKEINQFEILKGEIQAGNDNKELIKKFKGMLIRFTREGRIPRRECNEVLEELLHLGH